MARTRQPQGPTRIDWSNPLVRLLALAYVGGQRIDVVKQRTATFDANVSVEPVSYGLATRTPVSNGVSFGTGPVITGSSGAVVCLANPTSSGTNYSAAFSQRSTSPNRQFGLLFNSSGVYVSAGSLEAYMFDGNAIPLRTSISNTVIDGKWHSYGANFNGGYLSLFVDGAILDSSSPNEQSVGSCVDASQIVNIGTLAGASTNGADYKTAFLGVWNRLLSTDEYRSLSENPWQIFAPPRRIWIQLGAASGGAGATGTSAATLASVTGTAAGTLAIAAASAATLGAVTGTAAGEAAIAGTSAQSLAATTGTAAATLAIAATSAATLAATTGTAAGTLAIAATSAETIGAVTGAANGTTLGAASGTSAATLANTTGTAAGTLALAATSSATVGIVTGTSAGTISIGGASAQTLNDVTGVAVGNTTGVTNGVSIVTLDSVSGSAAGYADILATSSGALDAISGTAAGAISIIGVSADILADVTCGVPPPTLPLEVPTSSRTLAAAVIRLGASPLAAESLRLGATPTRKAPPRLG